MMRGAIKEIAELICLQVLYKSENKAAVLNKKIFTWKLEPKI